jgi:hypothetical protein
MIVNFYLKETDSNEDSITITLIKKKKVRSQSINSVDTNKMSKNDTRNIKKIIEMVEKYSQKLNGAIQIVYNL